MTTTSGFRPPHFSEDIAWLPEWLQPHQETSGDHHTNGAPTPSNTQACKVQGKIACETDVNLFARKDAGYNNCQLFLSGSDNSPAGMTPSGNVLHLYLHLSSNGVSQYTQSPVYTALPKERDESNGNPSMKPLLETSGCLQDQSVQNSMEVNNSMSHGQIKSNSRRFVKSGSSSLSKDNNISGKKHKKEVNCSNHLNVDITNAVELCIAASEALVVSETVNSVSAPEVLPASAVLEVALNVKQARHKLCPIRLENISNCVTDVVDETDLLQDLDEDSMADAYEDVGLSIRSLATTPDTLFCSSQGPKHGCSLSGTYSRVLETPTSENQCGYKVEVQNMKMKSQEVDSDGIFYQKKFNDAFTKDSISNKTASQSLDGERQVKLSCDPHLATNTSSAEKLLEPLLIQSLEENVQVTRNQFDLQAKNVPVELSTQQCLLSSPQIHKFGNDESEEVLFIEQDKFKSRWLGGWTGKDFNVSEQKDRIVDKTINKAVLRETSFISESADIVPNQNSVVKKLEDVPIIASLSSVAYEGLCSTPKGMDLSQDLMSSYNLSMADPLCSVVPCSISLDDTNLNVSNNKEKEADKCSNFILENGLEDLQVKDTGSLADFGSEKGCIRKINGEGYVATTRRQLASLKSYSMLMPTQKSDLERSAYQIGSVPNAGIPDFLTFEEDINCFKSSSRKETISYSKPTSKCPSNKKYREDRETLAVGAPMTKSASHEEHNDETAHHEAEIEFHHQNERSSPLILNYWARRRLQASKVVLNNDIGDGNQEMASVPKGLETRDGFCLANTFAPIPPLHSSHPNPCEDQGPSRKRVRFLEAEANKCQQRSGQKPRSRCKTRSNTKTGERLKKLILRPDSRTQEEITCLTNHHNKDWKKMIFQGIEFLLTGFSIKKERELEMLIRKHGGFILSDVPPPPTLGRTRRFKCKFQQFPVLITPKKVPTSKFLYGCAVNAFLLNVNWLTDSIMAGSLLPPKKYMILPNQNNTKLKNIGRPVHCAHVTHIFDKVGIMLHGKHSFCTHLEKIVRHGGGQVFKTLQWLVRSLKSEKISMGVIVVEDEVSASRHLRHCALEQKLPMMVWVCACKYGLALQGESLKALLKVLDEKNLQCISD